MANHTIKHANHTIKHEPLTMTTNLQTAVYMVQRLGSIKQFSGQGKHSLCNHVYIVVI